MSAEIGHFSLILALCFSLFLMVLPLVARYNESLYTAHVPLVMGQFLFVSIAYLTLTYAFLSNDFTVLYVANNSSVALPWWYKLCAIWGAHEGSMLLWVSILSLWMLLVTIFKGEADTPFLTQVLGVLAFISAGFFLFLLSTSNPFLRLFENVPKNGADLNPLLQDPGFLFHPPMLYMGYVGFSVAFAFAISSLIAGRVDIAWARWARPWTLAAWSFLTLGITLGSWWAYRELGWGGFWFWDPVENASFMPWLCGTALIHSLVVTEKRRVFRAWTVLLALLSFSLSLLGTFLVRSGVLTSVHAFAISPGRGMYMLVFLLVVVGLSLFIYALRANQIKVPHQFSLLSRETLLMMNNVFLTVTMLTVLLGTLYPLLIDALGYGKLSVGSPYFNQMFIWLCSPLLFFIGLGAPTDWHQMPSDILLQRIKIALLLAVFFAVILPYTLMGSISGTIVLGVSLGLWIIVATVFDAIRRLSLSTRNFNAIISMTTAHIGVAIATLGITLSTQYGLEKDVRMEIGDNVALAGYHLRFDKAEDIRGPNYQAVDASFSLYRDNQKITTLHPEKRLYDVGKMAMTDADVHASLFRDIYIALGDPLAGEAWSVRLYYKPFVRWIWAGGFLILFGGLMAMSRKRLTQESRSRLKVNIEELT